ncbi:MAG: hypothetical protein ACI8QG_001910 [Flavobacteriales bacterium]|jgi:hypothetical protein
MESTFNVFTGVNTPITARANLFKSTMKYCLLNSEAGSYSRDQIISLRINHNQ